MKFKPKVSIIIPVYNGENYLKEAIDSALNQTYNNIEVIVVNDGSIDNTEEIALSYGKKILYYKKSNGGVSTALNLGIKKMSGDYFSWLSHDDLYLPEKIETQINYLFQNNLINTNTILYSNYIIIDQNSEEIKKVILDTKVLNVKREYALLRGAINGITLLIPKKGFDDCGYFNENLRCAQDYDLWLRLQQKYKFIHIINVLTQTRIHNEQDTLTNPKVISEGNMLWIKMIESVLDERKVFLEENVYNYYYEMASFLGTSVYIKALEHCVNQLNELKPKYNLNINNFIKKTNENQKIINLIFKICISIKYTGLKHTFKKIYKKIIKIL